MRKQFLMAAIGVSLLFVATAVLARPAKRFDPGSQSCRMFSPTTIEEGRQLFKDNCKACHSRDNTAGAPFLHSESKISKAWNRIFEKRVPLCAQNGSWSTLTDEQLRRVNDFLYMNSADSYDPRNGKDCG